MANKFQLKRTSVSTRTPNTTSSGNTSYIDNGELAINTTDGKLFSSNGSVYFEVGANLSSLSVTTDATITSNATANIVITEYAEVNNYIDLTPITHPTHNEGRLYYDSVHKTLNYNSDANNINLELGTNEYIRVYNETGSTITVGSPLFLSGATATDPVVPKAVLADASNSELYNISGLAAHNIPNSTYGYCAVSGAVRGSNDEPFDTSSLTAGVRCFVSAVTPGTLITTAPSYPNFPMCVGICVVSDANNGVVIIEQQNHAVPNFRVAGDAYIGDSLTVAGDLSVLGTETTVSLTNISVEDTFIYLGSGDTISNTVFTGTGLNDMTYHGYYEGTTTKTFSVRIDGVGTGTGGVDTFEWSIDNFATTEATAVDITGDFQTLQENIQIKFQATTTHTSGDRWDGDVAPSDLDFGVIGNFSNTTLYSHAGMFRDASDGGKFKFFKRYDPEIEGTVDTANTSFQLGDVVANNFIGTASLANNATYLNGQLSTFYVSNTYADSTFAKLAGATFTGNVTISASLFTAGNTSITGTLTFTGNDKLVFADATTQNTAFQVFDSTGTRIA